jgi:hypothetical protein
VTATNGAWDPDGLEWGETYLNWFYPTMKSPGYAGKVTVGGVWAGFDDSLAAWGDNRFISRRGTETYDGTMALATQHQAPFIMIETWNDFEEGSDIEFGTAMAVNLDDNDAALLVRSSPLRVDWNPAHTVPVLQVYKEGVLLYNQPGINGAYFSLQSGCTYELKLWAQDLPSPLSRWVVIRHQDPIPGVTPVDADP